MILTCPDCATRFKIADDAIGPNGRTVRCSQCSTTWFVAADPDTLSLEEAEENQELREEVIREPVSDIAAEKEFSNHEFEDDAEPGTNLDKDLGLAAVGAHAGIRENAERKRVRRRLMGVGMIWLIPLLILSLFAVAAYLFRTQIVSKYPGAAQVYRAIGIQAESNGLEIYELKTRYETNEGVQAILVNGKIKNLDIKKRNVDMIRLSFKNAGGDVIDSWVVEPPKSMINAGEVLSFTTQFPNPPIDAVKLAPSFVTEKGAGSRS